MAKSTPPVETPALVGNAADPEQVEKAGHKVSRARNRELDDLRVLLDLPQGRRTIWRLLEHCRAFNSVMGANDSLTNYNAGQQDVGHFLFAEINQAKPDALVQMMLEARKDDV